MKKVILGLVVLCAAVSLHAQTSTNSFLNSVENYVTEENTNFNWTSNSSIELSTGYKQITGENAASTLEGQYDISRFNVGLALQFSGIGSAFNEEEGQIGYAIYRNYDTVIDIDLRGGYDNNTKAEVIEPAIFLKKKMTTNTFMKTGVSLPIETKGTFKQDFVVFVETGFTF